MVAALKKKRLLLLIAFCFFWLAVALVPSAGAAKPVFFINNGDAFTGGWFNPPPSIKKNCRELLDSSNQPFYQGPADPTDVANQYKGTLLAFANGRTGAGTEYAAYSLGSIQSDQTANSYGFYTGLGVSPTNLSFAEPKAGNWGGFFEGTVKQTNCVVDYFHTKQQGAAETWTNSSVVGTSLNTQYYCDDSSGCYDYAGGILKLVHNNEAQVLVPDSATGATHKTTIFVDGDVYIGSNITYPAGYTIDTIPKFALVVQGNIYIGPGVTQLDGLYIAQPDPADGDQVDDDTGVIWTCHDSTKNLPSLDPYIKTNCGSPLTINGAVIAKQINFVRTAGDYNTAPAETINYTPAMVLGGPFFNRVPKPTLTTQGIISLPPIF
jgi:hypothetical protein